MRRLLGYTVLQLTVLAAGDGVFSVQEEGFIKLVDLKNNKTTTNLVNMLDVKREDGEPITDWADWQLSADTLRSSDLWRSPRTALGSCPAPMTRP